MIQAIKKTVSTDFITKQTTDTNLLNLAKEYQQLSLINIIEHVDNTSLYLAKCQDKTNPELIYHCGIDLDSVDTYYFCNCDTAFSPCVHNLALLYQFANTDTDIELIQPTPEINLLLKNRDLYAPSKTIFNESKRSIQRDIVTTAQSLLYFILKHGIKNVDDRDDDAELFNEFVKFICKLNDYPVNEISKQANKICSNHFYGSDNSESLISAITRLQRLIKAGNDYLNIKANSPHQIPTLNNQIEYILGHHFEINELIELGMIKEDVNLIQFCFWPKHNDMLDLGYWLNLETGEIYLTYKEHIYPSETTKIDDDSVNSKIISPRIILYPNNINNRINIESPTESVITPDDIEKVHQFAYLDFESLTREVIQSISDISNCQTPIYLIRGAKVNWQTDHLVINDENGFAITLANIPYFTEHRDLHNNISLVQNLLPENISDLTLAVMFQKDELRNMLLAKPMAIFTQSEILRLIL